MNNTNLITRYINLLESNREIQSRIININAMQELNLYNLIQQPQNSNQRVRPISLSNSARINRLHTPPFSFASLFQDVVVRPTQQQIETATERLTYSDIENPINLRCPITQEEFNPDDEVIQIRHCRHCFTPSSLNNWFNSNVRCPVCRYDIRNNTERTNIANNENSSQDESTSENTINENTSTAEPNPTPQSNTIRLNQLLNGILSGGTGQDLNNYMELTQNLLNVADNLTQSNNSSSGIDIVYSIQH